MSFKKLDKSTEQAVMSAIEKIIDNTRHTPDADLNKVAAEVFQETDGMTPEMVRRACEAYNKSKSVHTLQKRAANDRAEDFPLIDSDLVINQVYGYHQKAASEFRLDVPPLQANLLDLHAGIRKVAAEDTPAENPLDARVLDRQIYSTLLDLRKQAKLFHNKVATHKTQSEEAVHRVCQVARRLPAKQLQKMARLTINRYGEDGVRFIKMVGAYIGSKPEDLPLQKTAAAAIFPLEEPYPSIVIAIDEARNHNHFKTMFQKTAEIKNFLGVQYAPLKTVEDAQAILDDPEAGESLKSAARLFLEEGMQKTAALGDPIGTRLAGTRDAVRRNIAEKAELGTVRALDPFDAAAGIGSGLSSATKSVTSRLLDPVVEFAKTPIYGQLTKDKELGKDEVFTASMRNELNQLKAQQAFIDIAADDFTKDYAIDDIMQAYNNVVGTMPDLLDPKYTPWLKALVREQLVQGNVYDSATIEQLTRIGKEIKKGRAADIDEATARLKEAGNKVVPGLDSARMAQIMYGGPEGGGGGDEGGVSRADIARMKGDVAAERAILNELGISRSEAERLTLAAATRRALQANQPAGRNRTAHRQARRHNP